MHIIIGVSLRLQISSDHILRHRRFGVVKIKYDEKILGIN
jgi:hypothetical protein